jgi:hypothetical protein
MVEYLHTNTISFERKSMSSKLFESEVLSTKQQILTEISQSLDSIAIELAKVDNLELLRKLSQFKNLQHK